MGLNSWKESQPLLPFLHTLILWIIVLFSFHSNELSATDKVIQCNRNTNRWVIDPRAFITLEFSTAVQAINSFICHFEIPGPFTRKAKRASLPAKGSSRSYCCLCLVRRRCWPSLTSRTHQVEGNRCESSGASVGSPETWAGEGQDGKTCTLYTEQTFKLLSCPLVPE